jgi:hypothetical protein
MAALTWLHLSDWHQKGKEFNRDVVRDRLLEDIQDRVKRINPQVHDALDYIKDARVRIAVMHHHFDW